jgi:hypothetical protein
MNGTSRLTVAATLLIVAGCGGTNYTPPAETDPTEARAVLSNVLDAWKSGSSAASLKEQSPPIYVSDHDWTVDSKLTGYRFLGEPTLHGNNARVQVQLQLSTAGKKPRSINATYIVALQPVISIIHSDMDE